MGASAATQRRPGSGRRTQQRREDHVVAWGDDGEVVLAGVYVTSEPRSAPPRAQDNQARPAAPREATTVGSAAE
jgi:hypothetical protein